MALITIANLNTDSLVSSDSFLTELQATDSSQVFGGTGSKKSKFKGRGGNNNGGYGNGGHGNGGYGNGGDNNGNGKGKGNGNGNGYGHGNPGYGGDDD